MNTLHGYGLQLLGVCGFFYFLGIVAGVVHGMATGRPIGLSVSVGLICGSLFVYFLLPRTMPDWLRSPVGATEAFAVLFSLVVAMIFVLGPMAGVAVAAFEPSPELVQRQMAMALIPAGVASLAVVATGFALAFLTGPEQVEDETDEPVVTRSERPGIEDVASDNDIPALEAVRMMRLSRT